MKHALVALVLLSPRLAFAFSANALVCFDTVQTADAVAASGEIEDSQVPHIHSMVSEDLQTLANQGASLVSVLPGEHAHSYLSRMLVRLRAAAPRLAREIVKANADLKQRVSFEVGPAGKVTELEDTSWRDSGLDQKLCMLAPVIANASPDDPSSPLLLDQRLFKKSVLTVFSKAVLLLRTYVNQIAPNLTDEQATAIIGLFLAVNPDATYKSYLEQLGAQGLLTDLPPDGKVWAAPGYEKMADAIHRLIDLSYPNLQDDTVEGGRILRLQLEDFAQELSPGFACKRKDIPQASDADGPDSPSSSDSSEEDPDFTCFHSCSGTLTTLLEEAALPVRKQGEVLLAEVSQYLSQKDAIASTRALANFVNPPDSSSGDPQPALREQLDGFGEFTDDDKKAIDNGMGILVKQIGESVATDAGPGPDVVLADPFYILRQTPLHYLTAKVPQIGDQTISTAQMITLWSEPTNAPSSEPAAN